MKRCITIKLILLALLMICACPQTSIYKPVPPETGPIITGPGESLFQQGEQALANDDLDQALEHYSRYLSQFPEGNRADHAVLRIGSIYDRKEMHQEAQAFYQRLISQYPDSPLANDARLAIMDMLVKYQKTEEAITLADQMLNSNLDEETRRQLWQRLEQYHSDTGQMANAVAYAYLLYTSAPQGRKEKWGDRLKEGINRLNIEDIQAIWERIDIKDDFARSHLMYRYATLQVLNENYDEAIAVLTNFQNTYPNHEYAQDAAQIISTIEQRLSFTPLTAGCLLPLSGPYKVFGQRALNGIELALSLMQSQSPEDGATIRLVIKDSASNGERAVEAVKELDEAGVGAIIGPIVTSLQAAGEAQRRSIPMVTFTQKSDITEVGDYIFRHFITPQSQVKALVGYFTSGVGLRDFAILYPKESYGQTFMTLFWEEVIRQGGRVVGVESYDTQQTDFATVIKKLVGTHYDSPKNLSGKSSVLVDDDPYFRKMSPSSDKLEDILPDPVTRLTGLFFQDPDQDRAKGPNIGRQRPLKKKSTSIDFDVLFIPDSPKTAGLILPQLAYHDVRDIYLAGTNLWHSDELIKMTRDYAQNAVMAEGFFSKSPDETVQRFVRAYQDLYGKDPGLVEAFAFDTAWFVFKLLSKPDIGRRHDFRDALLQLYETDGVTGPTAFAENGEAIKYLSLLKIQGEEFIEIPRQ